MRIALGQFNASVGDISGNIRAISNFYAEAARLGVDLLVLSELCVCGYPPEDLLHKEHFVKDSRCAVEALAADISQTALIVGFVEKVEGKCFNSLALLQNGQIRHVYHKQILPNYGVFDERRYFSPGTAPAVVDINGLKAALTICEDIWEFDQFEKSLAKAGPVDILINISASPFCLGKLEQRRQVLSRCAAALNCAVAYCNLVGGQDELVFDGRSMFLDIAGNEVCRARAFSEDMLIADVNCADKGPVTIRKVEAEAGDVNGDMSPIEEVYKALVLGTGDYVRKNGFAKVLVGLSGGIDSSLVAVIAADALGEQNVVGVTMPSKFNSAETISDAEKLAANLGIQFQTIPIGETLEEFDETLSTIEGWDNDGIAYENLQARIRGSIIMSLSNQFGYMVLTTGNKSEVAVGYATLYGDTAGGFAVIKDVPKTMVYQLSRYVNDSCGREVIPESVIDRVPSAELREGQKDSDSLPDYDLLDTILKGYIEQDRSAQQIIAEGLDAETVNRVIAMVDRNEYKRRQCPPGVKITPKAFGRDRRMPITNKYFRNKPG